MAFAAACSKTPPPKPPEPEPPKPEPAKQAEPPPAPKKCETLDEGCKAEADTKARVARAPLQFVPATGWTYAQGETITIAQLSDDGPCIAMMTYEVGDGRMEIVNREGALDVLAKQVGVTLPRKKPAWKRPDEQKKIGGLDVSMWQSDGGARGDKKGPLLVFDARIEGAKALLGIGFVPADDASAADEAILKSIESLGKSEGSS